MTPIEATGLNHRSGTGEPTAALDHDTALPIVRMLKALGEERRR